MSDRGLRLIAGVLAGLVTVAASPAAAQTGPGRLVIVGGGLSPGNEAVYRSILDARQGHGPLCVLTTAAADPASAIAGAVANFERYGGPGAAAGVLVDVARPETATSGETVARLRACSGFYFGGGVQSRITAALLPGGQPAPALTAVLERHREGAVVSGSSAGAAVMSDPMIAGGSSAGAVGAGVVREDGDTAASGSEAEDTARTRGVSVARGLGFFPGALVDQHFLARGRVGRLIVAVGELEEFELGFGIDENTALVVAGQDAWAAGASGVIILDARRAGGSSGPGEWLRLHLMSSGDRFDLGSRRLTIAESKAPLPPGNATVELPADVFARWQFLHLLVAFCRAPQQELQVPVPSGLLVLRKTADFAARSGQGEGVQQTPAGFSITGLELQLRRSRAPAPPAA